MVGRGYECHQYPSREGAKRISERYHQPKKVNQYSHGWRILIVTRLNLSDLPIGIPPQQQLIGSCFLQFSFYTLLATNPPRFYLKTIGPPPKKNCPPPVVEIIGSEKQTVLRVKFKEYGGLRGRDNARAYFRAKWRLFSFLSVKYLCNQRGKMFTNCLLQKNINCLYHFGYCLLREMFTFQRPQVRLRDEENRFLLLEQQQNALQS